MKQSLIVLTTIWMGLASLQAEEKSQIETRDDFQIRDPFVLVANGKYYLYKSKAWFGGKGVSVRVSNDLDHWEPFKEVMHLPESVKCWAVWAPEVHYYKGAYYLLTTITQDTCVRPVKAMGPGVEAKNLIPRGTWIFKSESPEGPFVPVKMDPVPPLEYQTLDGTLYEEDGKVYMVYCHEWCQMGNGTIEYAPLSEDMTKFTAAPKVILDARSAMEGASNVTDGPFLYRSEKSKRLYMIWSNFVRGQDYCVLVRSSASGKIAGPWTKDTILNGRDGGHAMIFKDLQGRLLMSLHQPNGPTPKERMRLYELTDDGEQLRVVRKLDK